VALNTKVYTRQTHVFHTAPYFAAYYERDAYRKKILENSDDVMDLLNSCI